MVALTDRARAWIEIRPRFERYLFRVGCRDAKEQTGLGLGTIHDLANGVTTAPHPRTIRDVREAVERWEASESSESERTVDAE